MIKTENIYVNGRTLVRTYSDANRMIRQDSTEIVYTNAFNDISADCEIRVPAALADEWKDATNWSTYADHIVGV